MISISRVCEDLVYYIYRLFASTRSANILYVNFFRKVRSRQILSRDFNVGAVSMRSGSAPSSTRLLILEDMNNPIDPQVEDI
jgi:hypothetical protein